jgi:hypothetical protein
MANSTTQSGAASIPSGERVFAAELLASNNSGVHGTAVFTLNDNALTVDISAKGLTPGEVHPQHIHGLESGEPSQLPTLAQDSDHDGFIEDTEAEQVSGPAILSLTASGTPTNDEHVPDFPTAGADGTLQFHQTYTLDPNNPGDATILSGLQALGIRAVELHGENVPAGEGQGTPGEVDGSGGYKQDLPVAAGLIHEVTGPAAADLVSAVQTGNFDAAVITALGTDPNQAQSDMMFAHG